MHRTYRSKQQKRSGGSHTGNRTVLSYDAKLLEETLQRLHHLVDGSPDVHDLVHDVHHAELSQYPKTS